MDSHSDPAASINPYPTTWSRWCPKCRTPSLKAPRLCKGHGKDIYNFGRHYQPCENTDCDEFLWNNPPTPLDKIPFDVQLRFTVRKSAAEDSETGILCVAEGCRTRAKNEPRKANVACGRSFPHCSSCCKRLGGCNLSAHRPDVQPNVPGTSSESSTSSQPAVSSSADIRRLWARPLSETYAKPYINSHRHLLSESIKVEEGERLKDVSYVLLWSKGSDPGPTAAQRFKLINSEPGRFIPNTSQAVVNASAASTTPNLISVFDSPMGWISQDLRLPIPVTSASRVLLRTCDMVDSDCLELDTEMSLSLSRAPAQQSSVGLRAMATSNVPAAAFVSTLSAATSMPSSELPGVASQPRAVSSGVPSMKSFPYRYTCDMAQGMNILSQVKNDGAGLASAFKEHFPGCPYVPKTLYKHLKSYRSAIGYHILDKYVAYQHTSNGKWSKLVEEVKKKEKNPPFTIDLTGGEPTVRRNSPPLIDVDVDVIGPSNTIIYDDSLPAHDFMRKMSFYRYEEDCLQDYSGFGAPNIQFTVFDNFVQGNKFRVHMATFGIGLPHLESVTLAVKKICLPDNWWVPWGSFGAAIWTEGARAYTCATLFQDFLLRARAMDILMPDIDVVPTSFISHLADAQPPDNKEWLGQPWHFGTPFSVHLLNLDDPVQSDVANILSAFSHYSYQATNHRSVYVDFQGIITLEGHWRVLDSCTHVVRPQSDNLRIQYGIDDDNDDDNETDADRRARPFSVNNTAHFFGSQGEFGLSAFRRTHNCTALCGILQLNPL